MYDVESTGVPTATYALTDPPAGMVIDPSSGIIVWTAGTPDIYDVTVTATNGAGFDTQAFSIYASPEPVCPADITSYWKLDETEGSTYLDSYAGLDGSASPAPPSPAPGGIVAGGAHEVFHQIGADRDRDRIDPVDGVCLVADHPDLAILIDSHSRRSVQY